METPKRKLITCKRNSSCTMSDHNSAVFNNTCLKVPRNPNSQQPSPIYEQKFLNHIQNQVTKLNLTNNMRTSPESEKNVIKSLVEFYDSIPEYDDMNHLSNKDFYRKLQNLKDKQQTFTDYIQREQECENKTKNWMEDYKNLSIKNNLKNNNRKDFKPTAKQFCSTPTLNKLSYNKLKQLDDVESLLSSDKEICIKPPSRRSVRIESPSDKSDFELQTSTRKSKFNSSPSYSKNYDNLNNFQDFAWDDLSVNDFRSDSEKESPLKIRSVPNSPMKKNLEIGWKDDGITIPKPFKMTVRDEENKIVDEVLLNTTEKKPEKNEMFRANPIPIESRIPLFEKIVADQEKRSQIVKQRSKENLRAQMRPFSFTRREERCHGLTSRLCKSSPSIFLDDEPIKVKQFRAKPVPKGLFSNYIYHKMNEDEFYRALQRKIRAEEMMKSSALPPSMAKREKSNPKFLICPRSYKALETDFDLNSTQSNSTLNRNRRDKELDDLTCNYISERSTSSRSRRKSAKKRAEKQLINCYGSSVSSSRGSRNASHYKPTSAADLLSVNKSNLAAVLRIQSAKKKMQRELCQKLEEAKIKEEARWREKVLRKRPAWQKLVYSHEEDLAMRLQLRRDEERLRNEEHRHRMELMFGRVNQMPMLFERQSQNKSYPITKQELINKLQDDYCFSKYNNSCHSSPLTLSDLSGKTFIKENEALDKLMKENNEEK